MTDNRKCGNCKWSGDVVSGGWRVCHLPLPSAGITDLHTHQDDAPCPEWAAMGSVEYRPSDGPFWAELYEGLWRVYGPTCGAQPGSAVFLTKPEDWHAHEYVDALNRACREWAVRGSAWSVKQKDDGVRIRSGNREYRIGCRLVHLGEISGNGSSASIVMRDCTFDGDNKAISFGVEVAFDHD